MRASISSLIWLSSAPIAGRSSAGTSRSWRMTVGQLALAAEVADAQRLDRRFVAAGGERGERLAADLLERFLHAGCEAARVRESERALAG